LASLFGDYPFEMEDDEWLKINNEKLGRNENVHVALMEAASFWGGVRHKRYSEQQVLGSSIN
jgi:hypothetical protein